MFRPLRWALLIYEVFRLIVVIGMIFLMKPEGEGVSIPLVLLGASNILYLWTACFILMDLSMYQPYIPLYTAGKIVASAAALGWLIFLRPSLPLQKDEFIPLGSGLFLLFNDVLSALGGGLLSIRVRQQLRRLEGPGSIQRGEG